jgi:hypothetical protein
VFFLHKGFSDNLFLLTSIDHHRTEAINLILILFLHGCNVVFNVNQLIFVNPLQKCIHFSFQILLMLIIKKFYSNHISLSRKSFLYIFDRLRDFYNIFITLRFVMTSLRSIHLPSYTCHPPCSQL